MKTITIYPTVVSITENINIDSLIAIPSFEEILDVDISPERLKELVEALNVEDISVRSIVIPDGFTDENTITKEQFKELLDIAKNCDNKTYGIIFDIARQTEKL